MAQVGLARALYRKERLSVLKLALIAFDHEVQPLHDKLCLAGAITVLVRFLETALMSTTIHWVEVQQTCQLIAMAYRCSDEVAAISLEAVGTDLIAFLFSILLRDQASRKQGSAVQLLIERIAQLESVSLAKLDQSGRLLLCLEQMALLGENDNVVSLAALSILAGLTSHPESRVCAMESRTFLDSLIKCSQIKTAETEAKHQIARVLRNLTLHRSNKSKMTKRVILEQLVELASKKQCLSTRIQAIQALKHISVEVNGKLFLVAFEGGRVVKTLLVSADDVSLRPHVVETLSSLACKCTASPLANYPNVISMLAYVASLDDHLTAEKAAQTIKRLATHISLNDKGHPVLFNAILLLSGSPLWRVRHWMAKAFLEQSRLSGCSFLLARSADAVIQISHLARDTRIDVQDAAIETLLTLSSSHANLKRLSMQSITLDTLVEAVRITVDSELEDQVRRLLCRNTVLALLNMTRSRRARKMAAHHYGVIASLSKYGLSDDDDDELKKAALHGVMLLSPLSYS